LGENKAAIHEALLDINKELHPEDKTKEIEAKKEEERKAAEKKKE